jgi:hypothetical protein
MGPWEMPLREPQCASCVPTRTPLGGVVRFIGPIWAPLGPSGP